MKMEFQKTHPGNLDYEAETHQRRISPKAENYKRFVGVLIGVVKRNIPRRFREKYISCCNQEA